MKRSKPTSRLILAMLLICGPLAIGPAAAQATGEMFKGFKSNSSGPVNVEADSLEVSQKNGQTISTFSGNVTVTRDDSVLKAGKITIYSADNKSDPAAKPAAAKAPSATAGLPGAGNFTRIEASGKVYVNSGEQTATGDTAVVDMVGKVVTLAGNVVLSQGPNVITGDRLIWDMETGKARVEQKAGARIRGVFTPGSTPGAPGTPEAGAAKKP
jgi:lipopolysaccharide export system protein LptA